MISSKSNLYIPRRNMSGEGDERTFAACFPIAGTSEQVPPHALESPEVVNPRG